MNLYERLLAPHWMTSVMSDSPKGLWPSREPLDWALRQGAFVFNSRREKSISYSVVLIDRVTINARVLLVTKVPKHALCSELLPYDLCIGFGGYDYYYDELLRRHGSPWANFPMTGWEGGERSVYWHDPAKGIDLVHHQAPFANLHVAGDICASYKPGDRICLEGVSCKVFIDGDPDVNEMSTSRSYYGYDCMSVWPACHPIEKLCDDAKSLPEAAVREMVRLINPRAYYSEEFQKIRRTIALEHKARAAGLLQDKQV